jgi:hypothetical protein
VRSENLMDLEMPNKEQIVLGRGRSIILGIRLLGR